MKEQYLQAGEFLSWLHRMRRALVTSERVEVPCGECRACCTSSYFIHIKSGETQTLAGIPEELLFPAPGVHKGDVLLGYDENGLCPLFLDNKCSIYEDCPQTCRIYDCRVFTATGLSPGDDKPLISQQAHRWKFDFPGVQDHDHFSAVQAAAQFLIKHTDYFPTGFIPYNPTQQAVLAIKVYEVFLSTDDEPDSDKNENQIHEIADAVIAAFERFEERIAAHLP